METSAKERINNEECFFQVVREIRQLEIPLSKTNGFQNTKEQLGNEKQKQKKNKKKTRCIIL
jgi:GTPase SAR1 family protein